MLQAILKYLAALKNFLNKLNAICERVCMEILKDEYYTELRNTTTNHNDHNNLPLSNVKVIKEIMKVMI